MASGPLKALLAVLAVAGFQNRDRIAEILKGVTERQRTSPGGATQGSAANAAPGLDGGIDDILSRLRTGGLGSLVSGGSIGSILNGGLSDLLDQFRQAGQEKKAESWVKPGANDPINDSELASALGPDVLRDIAARTGMSEEEILKRLSENLPNAVDGLTPDGTVPPASAT
ncbi:Hypothetical protein NGAL_HAMBI1146_00060 [Neorhizobium galegae bv. officinalis]|nr:Hypothetical protein NGAL_HAMBI1146_00060 [Neorhizobium galegae bv. officinalis]